MAIHQHRMGELTQLLLCVGLTGKLSQLNDTVYSVWSSFLGGGTVICHTDNLVANCFDFKFFCTDDSTFEMKIEADSKDITEYPAHYDQSSIGMIFCCILCSYLPHVGPESYRIDHSV